VYVLGIESPHAAIGVHPGLWAGSIAVHVFIAGGTIPVHAGLDIGVIGVHTTTYPIRIIADAAFCGGKVIPKTPADEKRSPPKSMTRIARLALLLLYIIAPLALSVDEIDRLANDTKAVVPSNVGAV
jgi:hypothetical protein